MPKRTSKVRPSDVNLLATSIVQATTDAAPAVKIAHKKNPAAVALGRLGGKKGGPARAQKLSAKRRKEIAQKAAIARWAKKF